MNMVTVSDARSIRFRKSVTRGKFFAEQQTMPSSTASVKSHLGSLWRPDTDDRRISTMSSRRLGTTTSSIPGSLAHEINLPWYGAEERRQRFAPWNKSKIAIFYPEPFGRAPHWGQHFVAYVRGANGIKTLPE